MTLTHPTPSDHRRLTSPSAAPVRPTRGRFRPLGLDEVRINGGFWSGRQDVNGDATLPHIESWLEREGWLGNFDLAASGRLPEGRRGREFADSEIYKYLEAVAWEIHRRGGDADLEQRFRAVVDRVAAAQEPDGYLGTAFGRPGQPARWSALEWGHELYCLGHLFQAAVARERTAPGADDGLVDIARRAADLVCAEFGPGAREAVCGHPEIELGLAELGRALHDERYVEQARLFVERRGHSVLGDIEWGRAYFQDDEPVRASEVLRGHAVRANYLAAGAVDVAVETGDGELLDSLRGQWRRTIERRTYVTGGQGSHHQDEAFGDDWELPADRAYSETCAGVASIMFSWRLLLAGDRAVGTAGATRAYADLIERTLYNVVATSPSDAGTSFFYANTLHQRQPGDVAASDAISPRASSSVRAPWFEVSCCPPNVARTLASLAGYVATTSDDGLQLHQFAPASIRTTLDDGRTIAVDVETEYPRNGSVTAVVREGSTEPWTLALRVPSWASGATLSVTGAGSSEGSTESVPVDGDYAEVRRAFRAGDSVVLTLPVEPRFTAPDPRIDAVRGCVVVERGPEVYCLESTDLSSGDSIEAVRVRTDVAPRLLDADGTTDGPVDHAIEVALETLPDTRPDWPYTPLGDESPAARPGSATVRLIPYHQWGERGASTMRVWLPTAP